MKAQLRELAPLLFFVSLVGNLVGVIWIVTRHVQSRSQSLELPVAGSSWYWRSAQDVFSEMPTFGSITVFAGDSITAQAPLGELFAGIVNRGVAGDTVAGLNQRLSEITSRKPDALIVLIGINDLLRGGSVVVVHNDIVALLKKASFKQSSRAIWLLSVLPIREESWGKQVTNSKIRELNSRLRVSVESLEANFVDVHASMIDAGGQLREEFTHDGLHLTPTGYATLRQSILAHIPGTVFPSGIQGSRRLQRSEGVYR